MPAVWLVSFILLKWNQQVITFVLWIKVNDRVDLLKTEINSRQVRTEKILELPLVY